MKSNVWMTTGHSGCDDYDGPTDDNVKLELIIGSRFTKADVEKIMVDYRSKFYCSVMIKQNYLGE